MVTGGPRLAAFFSPSEAGDDTSVTVPTADAVTLDAAARRMDLAHRPALDPSDSRSAARQLADAVIQALCAPRPSQESIRRAVVRYARAAHDLAIAADEMLAGLAPRVRRCLESLPSTRRAELLAYVEWWAIHGYYGAD